MANVVDITNRINPAEITDNDTGMTYTLDFSRESVAFTQRLGFNVEKALEFPAIGMPDLFFYSFRKNHRNVPREKVDAIREKWGGVPESLAKRLIDLYNQAQAYQTIQTDEDAEKNSAVTLVL
jgi:hypothetical protein